MKKNMKSNENNVVKWQWKRKYEIEEMAENMKII